MPPDNRNRLPFAERRQLILDSLDVLDDVEPGVAGRFGATPSSWHQAKYSSMDRSNSRRSAPTSVHSKVAIGYAPQFTTRPCRTFADSSNSTTAT